MAKTGRAAFRVLTIRSLAVVGCYALWCAGPAQAGFFDQLFGGLQSQQPIYNQPGYRYGPGGELESPLFEREPHRRKVVRHESNYEHPVLQKTTDLMHDHTLRRGDAVMMADGIHIYEGPESNTHTADEFVPLRDAAVAKTQLAALTQLDAARRHVAPLPVPAIRTAARLKRSLPHRASPIVVGMLERDGGEKLVRYVGP